MDYNFNEVEKKWQEYWRDNNIDNRRSGSSLGPSQ